MDTDARQHTDSHQDTHPHQDTHTPPDADTVTRAAADGTGLAPGDPRLAMAGAVAQARSVIAAVAPEQWDLPTPCEDMTVRDLLEHLVMVARRIACAGRSQPLAEWPVDAADVADGGWADAFLQVAHDIRSAWTDEHLADPRQLPWGTFPGPEVLGVYTNELTVHTWDLARATGQHPDWDDAVLSASLDAIHHQLPAADRGPMWESIRSSLPEGVEWRDPLGNPPRGPPPAPPNDRPRPGEGRGPRRAPPGAPPPPRPGRDGPPSASCLGSPRMDAHRTFLDRLPSASAERLLELGRERSLRSGAALVLEGDVATRVWVVLDGLVKVVSSHPDGRAPILALRGPGELIGELAALDGEARSATVTAVVPTRARELSGTDLRTLVREDPDLSLALLAHLTARLRDADRFRVSYMGDDVPRRLARCLLDLADRHGRPAPGGRGVELDIPLSQEDLAALVAASRDAVAKTLQGWRQQGLVSTARRSIVVLDRDALASRHGA